MACLKGLHKEGQNRVQSWTGTGAHTFIRVCVWSTLGFSDQGWIGQFKPKERGFAKPHVGYI